jgi:hypothetical protein
MMSSLQLALFLALVSRADWSAVLGFCLGRLAETAKGEFRGHGELLSRYRCLVLACWCHRKKRVLRLT